MLSNVALPMMTELVWGPFVVMSLKNFRSLGRVQGSFPLFPMPLFPIVQARIKSKVGLIDRV